MKENSKRKYFENFQGKETKELLIEFCELQYLYQQAVLILLLHPSPPYREEDIKFIRYLQTKISILKIVLKHKTGK